MDFFGKPSTNLRSESSERISGVYIFDQEHPDGFQLFDRHGYNSSFYHQFHDFYSCIVLGKTPNASAEYSLGEMKVALAMEKSNIEKMWVTPHKIN